MTHEINIYGDIVPFKWMNDGSEFDRADLNAAIDSLDLNEGDELIYNIHTFGGCTTTAFSMYNKLKRVQNEKKITLTSRADGYCASSGVILLLAAEKRIGSKYLKPFVHNAWTMAMGDKSEGQKVLEDLEQVDNAIAELYAEETSITVDEARQFMNESRDLTLDESIKFGFFTELENVKVVEATDVFNSLLTRRENFNINKMSKDKTFWNKIKKDIDAFLGGSGAQNKIVYTADNSELDFYELGEGDTPSVGDKARFDGKPAGETNEGEFVMADGTIYKFTGEELTEIEIKEDENELETENTSLKETVTNLTAEIENLKNERITLNKRISDAETIIKNFKKIETDDEDDEVEQRDPKTPKEPAGSRAVNALAKIKKNK